jgi:hypothetical protein
MLASFKSRSDDFTSSLIKTRPCLKLFRQIGLKPGRSLQGLHMKLHIAGICAVPRVTHRVTITPNNAYLMRNGIPQTRHRRPRDFQHFTAKFWLTGA